MSIYPYTFSSDSSLRNDTKKINKKKKVNSMACKTKKTSTKKTSSKKKPC